MLPFRLWRTRRTYAPLVTYFFLTWTNGGPASIWTASMALLLLRILFVKLFDPVMDRAGDMAITALDAIERRLPWRDEATVGMVRLAAALGAIVFGGFFLASVAVAVLRFLTGAPDALAKFGTAHGIDLDRDFLYVLAPIVLALIITAGATFWWHFQIWAYEGVETPEDERSNFSYEGVTADLETLHRSAEVAREYAWALTAIAIAVVPAVFKAGWELNFLTSAVGPLLIVAARIGLCAAAHNPVAGSRKLCNRRGTGRPYSDLPPILSDRVPNDTWSQNKRKNETGHRVLAGSALLFVLGLSLAAGETMVTGGSGRSQLQGATALLFAVSLGDAAWPWIRRERLVQAEHITGEAEVARSGRQAAPGNGEPAPGIDVALSGANEAVADVKSDAVAERQYVEMELDQALADGELARIEIGRLRAELAAASNQSLEAAGAAHIRKKAYLFTTVAALGVTGVLLRRRGSR